MKSGPHLFAMIVALGAVSAQGPSISYFTNVRDVRISQSDQQNYFVVDEEVWTHARPDLADWRVYDGESQVQYALSEQRGGTSTMGGRRILNLGVWADALNSTSIWARSGYDRIRLQLDAKISW
jgi:hypothetical protein